jgi:hypothetical protein
VVALVVPAAVTAYFTWIWRDVSSRNKTEPKYSVRDETWIFYSWFLAGVFGLSLSKFGLVGIEAAMLQERFWQADNAMTLMMHSGSTWSGASGWFKSLLTFALRRKEGRVGLLWSLLAFLSAMSFIALPLSGLSMELGEGYIESGEPPMMIGRNFTTFNFQPPQLTANRGFGIWESGGSISLPLLGVAYTPPDIDRDAYDFLQRLPNSLPLKDGISEVFIAQQAEVPIRGKVWGVRAGYNCSIVKSVDEFTILSQKSSSTWYTGPGEDLRPTSVGVMKTPSGDEIHIFGQFGGGALQVNNVAGYAEVGVSVFPHWRGYTNGSEPGFSRDGGDILEYALWQTRSPPSYREQAEELGFEFDDSIDTPIAGLGLALIHNPNGTVSLNLTFQSIQGPNAEYAYAYANRSYFHPNLTQAPPIGVRCRRSSDLGYANVDLNTFTSFERTLKPPFDGGGDVLPTPRLGGRALEILRGPYVEIFSSVHVPPPLAVSNSQAYRSYVKPQHLLESILRAHAVDALLSMYDGINSPVSAYSNPNATSSRPGKVLEPGVIPWAAPFTFFLIWAVGCALLACIYGFRRRWSEILDGYSLFRFGADFADQVRDRIDFSSVDSFEDCKVLPKLPGLIGDSRPMMDIGHITLVPKGNVARKDKKYI